MITQRTFSLTNEIRYSMAEYRRNIILPVVLYWCEIWFLILWEGLRLKVFENRMLRKNLSHTGTT
jgi:hypothetical protein